MEGTNSFNWILKMQSNEHIGVWVTKDGYIRHEFMPNGRYIEARGNEKNAYTGFYAIRGKHVEYLDDTGFTAEGDFIDGVYFHAGMMLYKESA
ncbi:protein Atu4866 [Mucilaginibacter pineti]|uniref:Protein Atu4866 n=1 Tax=Mucilaginibacter pineti TaxID=1391627 RepID=A0A1G7DN62_9SPHI|nr:Atu4866 domain-containing protein [Mucilaginibacter pineti]SDE52931.1 protein Atu4866 [Mucilaginibacter pineti]